jgi:peptidoglycan-associated lipoprotein
MKEIPVRHKLSLAGLVVVPIWAWVLGAFALAGVIGLVVGVRQYNANRTVENTIVVSPSPQCAGDSECADKQLCMSAACVEIKAGLADCVMAQVYFNTDSAEIRAEDSPAVLRMARCLKADQSMKLAIAGNADERGTDEHNAELGEKRAMAVARTLQAQEVSAKQLSVVSYGDNYPLCLHSDQDCWRKNRRASLTPQAMPELR